jgi:hypothetical protein
VLVDFDNVQPDLSALANSSFKLKVFFGANWQKGRVPFDLLRSMMSLGEGVELVEVKRSGKNAVDMHIAYYVGRLIEREPDAVIHIISGDKDFDPLVETLRADGVKSHRTKSIADVVKADVLKREAAPKPAPQRPRPPVAAQKSVHPPKAGRAPAQAVKKPENDRLAPIIKHLYSLSGKPATRRKLEQTMSSYFRQHGGALPINAVEQLIDDLIRLKYVSQSGTKVSYHLTGPGLT